MKKPTTASMLAQVQQMLGRVEEKGNLTFGIVTKIQEKVDAHMLDQEAHGLGARRQEASEEAETRDKRSNQLAAWLLVGLTLLDVITKFWPTKAKAEEPVEQRPAVYMHAK